MRHNSDFSLTFYQSNTGNLGIRKNGGALSGSPGYHSRQKAFAGLLFLFLFTIGFSIYPNDFHVVSQDNADFDLE